MNSTSASIHDRNQTQPMSLEGSEALKLYVAKIDCNLGAMKEQLFLLPIELERMKELLCELAACRLTLGENLPTQPEPSSLIE